MGGSERRLHHRGAARPGRHIHLEWRAVGGAWAAADTRDIGVGGAFLLGLAVPVGTQLELAVPMPGRGPLILGATVRWAAREGVGVQFLDVDIDVLLELNTLLAEHADGA